jgi:hypothetical protein
MNASARPYDLNPTFRKVQVIVLLTVSQFVDTNTLRYLEALLYILRRDAKLVIGGRSKAFQRRHFEA